MLRFDPDRLTGLLDYPDVGDDRKPTIRKDEERAVLRFRRLELKTSLKGTSEIFAMPVPSIP